MSRLHLSRRFRMAVLIVSATLVLTFLVVPVAPAIASDVSPLQPNSACAHVLQAATSTTPLVVECFLNTTSSYTFEPNELQVPVNASVVFSVGDIGLIYHTFTLDSVANDSQMASMESNAANVAASTLDSYMANRTAVNLYINGSGPYVSKTVPLSKPYGVYTFMCLVQGHFQDGMYGSLYVGLTAPAPAPTTITLNPLEIDAILLTSGAVIVGLFLVLTGRKKVPEDISQDSGKDDKGSST